MLQTIKTAYSIFILPYCLAWMYVRGHLKGNSGHMAGLGEGFLIIAGLFSFAAQVLFAIFILLIFSFL